MKKECLVEKQGDVTIVGFSFVIRKSKSQKIAPFHRLNEKGSICPVCNINKANTRDHIIPVSLGRILDKYGIKSSWKSESNIRYVCGSCNTIRGNKLITKGAIDLLDEFFKKAEQENRYISKRESNTIKTMRPLIHR